MSCGAVRVRRPVSEMRPLVHLPQQREHEDGDELRRECLLLLEEGEGRRLLPLDVVHHPHLVQRVVLRRSRGLLRARLRPRGGDGVRGLRGRRDGRRVHPRAARRQPKPPKKKERLNKFK